MADKMEKIKTGYYVESIDGLRAFAVLAVIIYHLGFEWMVGGYLGVTIFFVISGYLITNLLLKEYKETKKINLMSFWLRRAKRLLPALFTMLLGVISYISIFRPELMEQVIGDFWAAFFYVSNWWYIFEDQSYFEAFQSQNVLTHLWSLAIEEQFYFIWPIFLLIFISLGMCRKKLGTFVIFLGLCSAIWMAVAYNPTVDPSRVYYGTDTRAFSLLFGAALAVFRSNKRRFSVKISKPAKGILISASAISFLALLAFVILLSEYNPLIYYGGMCVVSILTVMLLSSLLHPSNFIQKIFAWKPFVWIGKRSYSLYLWHFPIIILTTPVINTAGRQWELLIFQVILMFALSECSYRLIETPIRYGYFFKKRTGKIRYTGIISATAIVGILSFSVYNIFNPSIVRVNQPSASILNEKLPDLGTAVLPSELPVYEKEETKLPANNLTPNINPTPVDDTSNDVKAFDLEKSLVTFIGDSIILDVIPYIEAKFPKSFVDGEVGRQMWDLDDVILQLKKDKNIGDILVLTLGTNGAFRAEQLQEILDSLEKVEQVVLVNTRVPRKWQNHVNRALKKIKEDNPEVILLDWYSESANHAEYFVSDGVHLTKVGSEVYANMIYESLNK